MLKLFQICKSERDEKNLVFDTDSKEIDEILKGLDVEIDKFRRDAIKSSETNVLLEKLSRVLEGCEDKMYFKRCYFVRSGGIDKCFQLFHMNNLLILKIFKIVCVGRVNETSEKPTFVQNSNAFAVVENESLMIKVI